MIFDTDVLIWYQRGNEKAIRVLDEADSHFISLQTYMELLQGAAHKKQQQYLRDFITEFGFIILPLTEQIGYRAAIYIEEFALSDGLRAGDAIIAATAVENNMDLMSGNRKHFHFIPSLKLNVFTVC